MPRRTHKHAGGWTCEGCDAAFASSNWLTRHTQECSVLLQRTNQNLRRGEKVRREHTRKRRRTSRSPSYEDDSYGLFLRNFDNVYGPIREPHRIPSSPEAGQPGQSDDENYASTSANVSMHGLSEPPSPGPSDAPDLLNADHPGRFNAFPAFEESENTNDLNETSSTHNNVHLPDPHPADLPDLPNHDGAAPSQVSQAYDSHSAGDDSNQPYTHVVQPSQPVCRCLVMYISASHFGLPLLNHLDCHYQTSSDCSSERKSSRGTR